MNDVNRPISRRQFVTTSALASSLLILPRRLVAGSGEDAPSTKLNIAGIGVGGMGANNLRNLESQNIVVLCDVDLNYAAKTIAKYPGAKVWTDYREMLDKQKDIATPDRHARGRPHRVGCRKPEDHQSAGREQICSHPISSRLDAVIRLGHCVSSK